MPSNQKSSLVTVKRSTLMRLFRIAQEDSGKTVAAFLLGLHNGSQYPFNLNQLRCVSPDIFNDCLALLELDQKRILEVKEYCGIEAPIWEYLATKWQIKKTTNNQADA